MDITGTHSVPGPRDRVFAALCDPAVLMRCIPVLEEMERLSATDYAARVRTTLGPMKARFSGRLRLEPEDGAHRYRLFAQGSGGLAGAVKGDGCRWVRMPSPFQLRGSSKRVEMTPRCQSCSRA